MTYCLDTNVIVRALRGTSLTFRNRLKDEAPENIMIPEMVRAELLTGALKSAHFKKNLELVNQFLEPFFCLPFGSDAAEHYAEIRAKLEKSGKRIGPNDLIIAATVRASGACLITENLREFKRVPGLRCESW